MKAGARSSAAAALFIVPALAGCILSPSPRSAPTEPAAPRTLTRFTYYEEGKLVFFCVNVFPARLHREDDWIPLEIGIANRGLKSLTVNIKEGVRLRDAAGQEWPTASLARTAHLRTRDRFDRQADPFVLREVLQTRFAVYQFVAPNFGFQDQGESFSRVVPLPLRSFTTGLILVENPRTRAVKAKFELWLDAPELEDPVFVPFVFD